jgi:hypothetical protein
VLRHTARGLAGLDADVVGVVDVGTAFVGGGAVHVGASSVGKTRDVRVTPGGTT